MQSRFDGGESPLQGSRAILPFHDEALCMHPASVASEGAIRVSEILVESLRWACPELYQGVQAPPALMDRLHKGAEPVWERGLLKDGKPARVLDSMMQDRAQSIGFKTLWDPLPEHWERNPTIIESRIVNGERYVCAHVRDKQRDLGVFPGVERDVWIEYVPEPLIKPPERPYTGGACAGGRYDD
jgi:hypothetical protein